MAKWFKNPIKSYKKIRQEMKDDDKNKKIKEIRNDFYINERNGSVYVICNGQAIYKASPTDTAEQIINVLENARNTAIEYKDN